jgi:2'-5' RNA ligase
MRLFTAILFNDDVKDRLEKIKNTVRANAIKGSLL